MREITDHRVNPVNDTLKIEVLDQPGAGGANHRYQITGYDPALNPSAQNDPHSEIRNWPTEILFQNGPIAEAGANGVTQETLIAICVDRLRSFQAGPYACEENALALTHLEAAQEALLSRTRKRMERGVEGTNQK